MRFNIFIYFRPVSFVTAVQSRGSLPISQDLPPKPCLPHARRHYWPNQSNPNHGSAPESAYHLYRYPLTIAIVYSVGNYKRSRQYQRTMHVDGMHHEFMSRIKWISPSRVFLYSSCYSLRWRHNGRDSVSNHHPHDCLLNRLFRRRSKKTSNLMVSPKITCAKNNMNKQSIKSKWLSTYSLWICRSMYEAHDMKPFSRITGAMCGYRWIPITNSQWWASMVICL